MLANPEGRHCDWGLPQEILNDISDREGLRGARGGPIEETSGEKWEAILYICDGASHEAERDLQLVENIPSQLGSMLRSSKCSCSKCMHARRGYQPSRHLSFSGFDLLSSFLVQQGQPFLGSTRPSRLSWLTLCMPSPCLPGPGNLGAFHFGQGEDGPEENK
jgi:hypothetical protein